MEHRAIHANVVRSLNNMWRTAERNGAMHRAIHANANALARQLFVVEGWGDLRDNNTML